MIKNLPTVEKNLFPDGLKPSGYVFVNASKVDIRDSDRINQVIGFTNANDESYITANDAYHHCYVIYNNIKLNFYDQFIPISPSPYVYDSNYTSNRMEVLRILFSNGAEYITPELLVSAGYQHYLFGVVPYGEAIFLFKYLLSCESLIAKTFGAFEFFVFHLNKGPFFYKRKQYQDIIIKLFFDKNPLIYGCVRYMLPLEDLVEIIFNCERLNQSNYKELEDRLHFLIEVSSDDLETALTDLEIKSKQQFLFIMVLKKTSRRNVPSLERLFADYYIKYSKEKIMKVDGLDNDENNNNIKNKNNIDNNFNINNHNYLEKLPNVVLSKIFEFVLSDKQTFLENLFNISLVSKRFFSMSGNVLSRFGFEVFELTNELYISNISSPYSMFNGFKITSGVYHELIANVPYSYVPHVFKHLKELTIDSTDFHGDVHEVSLLNAYTVFPSDLESLETLKILNHSNYCTQIGTFKSLIDFILIHASSTIETLFFEYDRDEKFDFDFSLFFHLMIYHRSTLKTVKFKFHELKFRNQPETYSMMYSLELISFLCPGVEVKLWNYYSGDYHLFEGDFSNFDTIDKIAMDLYKTANMLSIGGRKYTFSKYTSSTPINTFQDYIEQRENYHLLLLREKNDINIKSNMVSYSTREHLYLSYKLGFYYVHNQSELLYPINVFLPSSYYIQSISYTSHVASDVYDFTVDSISNLTEDQKREKLRNGNHPRLANRNKNYYALSDNFDENNFSNVYYDYDFAHMEISQPLNQPEEIFEDDEEEFDYGSINQNVNYDLFVRVDQHLFRRLLIENLLSPNQLVNRIELDFPLTDDFKMIASFTIHVYNE